jgi:hypothetical protein
MVKRRSRTLKNKNKKVNKKVNSAKRVKNKKTGGMHRRAFTLKNPTRDAIIGLPQVDQGLRSSAFVGPGSGLPRAVFERLTQLPYTVSHSTYQLAASAVDSAQTPGLAEALRLSAQRLHAHSLRPTDTGIQSCAAKNQQAVKQLKRAIQLGSLPARADLANTWLHGPAGVPKYSWCN